MWLWFGGSAAVSMKELLAFGSVPQKNEFGFALQ
jgi:hypothetical protein